MSNQEREARARAWAVTDEDRRRAAEWLHRERLSGRNTKSLAQAFADVRGPLLEAKEEAERLNEDSAAHGCACDWEQAAPGVKTQPPDIECEYHRLREQAWRELAGSLASALARIKLCTEPPYAPDLRTVSVIATIAHDALDLYERHAKEKGGAGYRGEPYLSGELNALTRKLEARDSAIREEARREYVGLEKRPCGHVSYLDGNDECAACANLREIEDQGREIEELERKVKEARREQRAEDAKRLQEKASRVAALLCALCDKRPPSNAEVLPAYFASGSWTHEVRWAGGGISWPVCSAAAVLDILSESGE